jgi:hypothetical protein
MFYTIAIVLSRMIVPSDTLTLSVRVNRYCGGEGQSRTIVCQCPSSATSETLKSSVPSFCHRRKCAVIQARSRSRFLAIIRLISAKNQKAAPVLKLRST